jgi:hypothetical protein
MNTNIDKAVNDEIIKRLKMKLCDVNRDLRNFNGNMETSEVFRELITKRLELKTKIDSLK